MCLDFRYAMNKSWNQHAPKGSKEISEMALERLGKKSVCSLGTYKDCHSGIKSI